MELIRRTEAINKSNSDKCKVLEYSFDNKDIDLGVAIITGRYPENDYSINLKSKSLVYVLEGTGKLYLEDRMIDFFEGDSILIDKNEKYYWESDYCKVAMVCTPAWSVEQYKVVG